MNNANHKVLKRERRHRRIRAKVKGTADKPRLSVFKSNRYMYGQIIDDEKGVTLASITTQKTAGKGMLEKAKKAGLELAKAVSAHKIEKVVFDRGGFIYTGRIKAFAEGAREGGLKF